MASVICAWLREVEGVGVGVDASGRILPLPLRDCSGDMRPAVVSASDIFNDSEGRSDVGERAAQQRALKEGDEFVFPDFTFPFEVAVQLC